MVTINKITINTTFLSVKTEKKIAELLTILLQFEEIRALRRSEVKDKIRYIINNGEECTISNSDVCNFLAYYEYDVLQMLDEQETTADEIEERILEEIVTSTRIELTSEYDA